MLIDQRVRCALADITPLPDELLKAVAAMTGGSLAGELLPSWAGGMELIILGGMANSNHCRGQEEVCSMFTWLAFRYAASFKERAESNQVHHTGSPLQVGQLLLYSDGSSEWWQA
jgi:hypothetical protein